MNLGRLCEIQLYVKALDVLAAYALFDAEEELDQFDKVGDIRDRHAKFYLSALAERESDLMGADQIQAVNDIEANFENIRAAWVWAIEREYADLLIHSLESLYIFCWIRSRRLDAVELFNSVVVGGQPGSMLHARAVVFYELTVRQMEKRPDAIKKLSNALTTLVDLGDRAGKRL